MAAFAGDPSYWGRPVNDFDGKYEFGFGKVTVIRSFDVSPKGVLRSPLYGAYTWGKGVNTCYCSGDEGKCSRTYCTCGFYGYYRDVNRWGTSGAIYGIIDGWGKCTIGSKGVRCEHAKIVALVTGGNVSTGWRRWFNFPTAGYIASLLFLIQIVLLTVSPNAWYWVLAMLGYATYFLAAVFISEPSATFGRIGPIKTLRLRHRYRGIPVYRTVEQATKHHPLSAEPAEEQSA